MFRCLSWLRRAGVTLMLLASLATGGLGLHHAADRDVACNPILVTHDSSAHHIGPAAEQDAADSQHCILCHSLRSFHPAFDRFEQPHYTPRAERLHIAPIHRARLLAWTLVPGRAPPV